MRGLDRSLVVREHFGPLPVSVGSSTSLVLILCGSQRGKILAIKKIYMEDALE